MKLTMKRSAMVDAAKALAIFTVILGHAIPGESELFAFLFAFHMPAFFFFSGYCMKPHFPQQLPPAEYVRRKARALLIPYGIFCIYGLILALLFPADWWNTKGLSYNLQRYLYYAQPSSGGSVWFLVCLFFSSLIAYGAVKLADLCRKPHSSEAEGEAAGTAEDFVLLLEILFLGAAGTILIPKITVPYHQRLPWKIDAAVTASAFQLLGYLFAKRKLLEKIPKILRYAGLVILPIIVWFVAVKNNTYVNLCDICYGNPFRFFIAALAGTLWLFDLGWLLQDFRLLSWLGIHSLLIFAIHTFPLWICTEIYSKATGVHSYHVPDIFWAFVISIITYAVCAAFAFLWDKTALHRIIRRWMGAGR